MDLIFKIPVLLVLAFVVFSLGQGMYYLAKDDGDEDKTRVVRALTVRTERSPDPVYRAYQTRLLDYNCAFAARVHNAMSAGQRAAARMRLQGWEDDLRALSQSPPS